MALNAYPNFIFEDLIWFLTFFPIVLSSRIADE